MRRALRINEGVDPNMIGVEVADAKHGRHMAPRRLKYLRLDLTKADALGRLTTRVARHVGRARPAA
jgi:hypothetical protein